MKKHDVDMLMLTDYCEPTKKLPKGFVGVYRQSNTRRRERCGVETDGKEYLRIYNDSIDSGSDFILPIGVVKELFRKIKQVKKKYDST